MRRSGRAVVGATIAAMVIGALTGCSDQSGDDGDGDGRNKSRNGGQSTAKGEDTKVSVARSSGKKIGAKGTTCTLPVTFDLAKSWEPDAIDQATTEDKEVAELLEDLTKQGEVEMVCEIDAKPAGHIGFIRIYTGKATAGGGDSRKVLEGFVADGDKPSKEKFHAVKVAGLDATEATYMTYGELAEESKEERAVAVVTPKGAVVIHLGGMDTGEHRAMVPAFELAKKTMAVTAG
ncbi:lipoprotein [Streptomyces sp. NPDC018031]|uniref:lipoprotein n=1 Tax=Streptomyces sp. NPDC018031 TaxID=3365033 RepID=UPI003794EE03